MAEWIPGQPTEYYPEGGVHQTDSGAWFIRRDGSWQRMTDEEVQTYLQEQAKE